MLNTTENNFRKEMAALLKKYNAVLSIDDGGGEISGIIEFDITNKSCNNLLGETSVGVEMTYKDLLNNIEKIK